MTHHVPIPSSQEIDMIILDIILKNKIHDHHDLLRKLKDHHIHLTQSTLSRRLNKLGIAKIQGSYQKVLTPASSLPPLLNIETSPPNLIVLHTFPGHAGAVGIHLDHLRTNHQESNKGKTTDTPESPLGGFLGTIAGDDTILVIVKNQTFIEPLKSLIAQEFSYS